MAVKSKVQGHKRAHLRLRFMLCCFVVFTIPVISHALPPDGRGPTIGPELSFASDHTRAASRERKVRHARLNSLTFGLWKKLNGPAFRLKPSGEMADAIALKDKIMSRCPDCIVQKRKGKFGLNNFQITFPNQYWIRISVDPGRVEVQTQHLPSEDYEALEPFVEENLYAPAAEESLLPVTDTDGHTNIGILSAFEKVGNFAEFLLDLYNHPELGLGVLGFDLHNAPHLIDQSQNQRDAFSAIMNEVKSGRISTHKELAVNIVERVHYRSKDFENPSSGAHYQSVSLKRAVKNDFPQTDTPVELRFTAARKNFALVLLNYRLFVARIKFLKGRPEFTNLRRDLDAETVGAMTPSEKLSRFYIFVAEIGENLKTYRRLIYDPQVAKAQLDSFVTGQLHPSVDETVSEFLRYVPDLEVSLWVRDRMRQYLEYGGTPSEVKVALMRAIAARLARTEMREENKLVLKTYFEELQPVLEGLQRAGLYQAPQDELNKGGQGDCVARVSELGI